MVVGGHDQRVESIAFSPDGERIVSGSFDSSLRLWNAHTLTPLISLRGHDGPVNGVSFSADSKRIYSVSFDNTGLPEGTYFGSITVNSQTAANSPSARAARQTSPRSQHRAGWCVPARTGQW